MMNLEKFSKRLYGDDFDGKVDAAKINEAVNGLPDREQRILKMRFGFQDGITHTLEEVAKEFGVTRERIRQLEAKSLMRIRRYLTPVIYEN